MSQFYNSVKRSEALRKRLSRLQGKLKFAIRRSNRKQIIDTLFQIAALETRIEALERPVAVAAQPQQQPPIRFTVHDGQLFPMPATTGEIFTVHNGQLVLVPK